MADAPDFVLLIQIGITLDQGVVPPSASSERAILVLDRYEGDGATYQTVVSYTVPVGKSAILSSLEIASDNYEATWIKVTIAGVSQIVDKAIPTTFNPTFANVSLSAGQSVIIQALSADGSAIRVDGAIEGKEIG